MNDLADASDTNLQSTTKMGEDLKNFAHMDRIDIQIPLFDRFIHVLCNDINYYMEEALGNLTKLKEREVKGITVSHEDAQRFDENQRSQQSQGAAQGQDDAQPGASTRPVPDRELMSMAYNYNLYGNTSLLLLSALCTRGRIALLRPAFSSRIAVIVGGYLHRLTNRQHTDLFSVKTEVRKAIQFSPRDLISLFVRILGSLAHVPSAVSIAQLTQQAFTITHPLANYHLFEQVSKSTLLGSPESHSSAGLVSSVDDSMLGGLALLKALTHKDAKFNGSDFNLAISVLLRQGASQSNTQLENDILQQPFTVLLATTRADALKHGTNYNNVKSHILTSSSFSLSSALTNTSKINTEQQTSGQLSQQNQQHRLVVYGTSHDDRSRAISRCQARAIGALTFYLQTNALKGLNDGKATVKPILDNQNQCTVVNTWSWLYSNPQALTIAYELHQYGLSKEQKIDEVSQEAINYVDEIGLAWWPLPPPTAPIFASLLNALKGEHEWDEYLTLQHFAPNQTTIEKLKLSLTSPGQQNHQHFQSLMDKYQQELVFTPQLIEKQYGNVNTPSYTYYTRPTLLNSEFWLKRIISLYNVYNAVLTRDERLLGTAAPTFQAIGGQQQQQPQGEINYFDFSNDDGELETPDEFLDDCFYDIMSLPVKLPQSHSKLEWLALYRALLTSELSPIDRTELFINSILPLPHIQYAIKLFKLRRGVIG
jgi:hypothetical protein